MPCKTEGYPAGAPKEWIIRVEPPPPSISTFEEVLPELDTTQISTGEGYRVVVSAFDFAGVADCEPYHRRLGEESAAWAVP